VWKDDATLFADAVESDPESPIMQRSYGRALCELGQLDEGERHLGIAARIYLTRQLDGPWHFPQAIEDMAKVHELRGDLVSARGMLEEAVGLSRKHEVENPAAAGHEVDCAASALGQFLLRHGDPAGARAAFRAGIEFDDARARFCKRRLAELDSGAAPTSRSDPAAPFGER
jgi:hypothetical protein